MASLGFCSLVVSGTLDLGKPSTWISHSAVTRGSKEATSDPVACGGGERGAPTAAPPTPAVQRRLRLFGGTPVQQAGALTAPGKVLAG